jgi:hypothetical protein
MKKEIIIKKKKFGYTTMLSKKSKFRYFGSKKEFKLKPIFLEEQEKDSHGRGGGFEGSW